MDFSSVAFLLFFLPIVFLLFAAIGTWKGNAAAIALLIVSSLVFYSWHNQLLLAVIFVSMAFNYGAGFIVKRRKQGWVLAAIIAANIGALIWFKYANTFLGLMADAGLPLTIDKVLFPLAISFFTFRQIAYVIDVRNGVAEIPGFAEYAFVITFFPNLIAGPLVRHSEMVQQLRAGALRPDWTNFAVGVTLFSIGLFKKVVLSEMARPYADRVFDGAPVIEHLTFVTAWTGSLAYGLQIYFDFSGYSDMAIGLARMFGFKLPLNFHSPYKAASMIDFWQRWHMSMTHFFTTYLYNPMVVGLTRRRAAKGLGTSPKDLSRPGAFVMVTALPTLATMVVMGMWHGNNVMFALFGLLHGVYLVLNRGWRAVQKRYGFKWGKSRPAFLASWLLTFLAVTAAWAVFRSPDLAAAAKVVPALFGANGFYLPESYGLRLGAVAQVLTALGIRFEAPVDILIYPSVAHLWKLAVLVGVALALPNSQQWLARFAPALNPVASAPRRQWSPGLSTGMLTAVVFVICLVLVHVNQQSSFIYFQF